MRRRSDSSRAAVPAEMTDDCRLGNVVRDRLYRVPVLFTIAGSPRAVTSAGALISDCSPDLYTPSVALTVTAEETVIVAFEMSRLRIVTGPAVRRPVVLSRKTTFCCSRNGRASSTEITVSAVSVAATSDSLPVPSDRRNVTSKSAPARVTAVEIASVTPAANASSPPRRDTASARPENVTTL